jgi:hypothetical protein
MLAHLGLSLANSNNVTTDRCCFSVLVGWFFSGSAHAVCVAAVLGAVSGRWRQAELAPRLSGNQNLLERDSCWLLVAVRVFARLVVLSLLPLVASSAPLFQASIRPDLCAENLLFDPVAADIVPVPLPAINHTIR